LITTHSEKSNESNAKQRQSNSLYYLYISIYKYYSTSVALLLKKSVFPYNNWSCKKSSNEKIKSNDYQAREVFYLYTNFKQPKQRNDKSVY